jgi:hypothetical protein
VTRPADAADARDPHLRLPKALRTARVAEAVFVVVTSYVALSLPLADVPGGAAIRARLVFEACVAVAVLLLLPRRPEAVRWLALALAAFVLIGCVPHLAYALPAVAAAPTALAAHSLLITLAACGSQLVVLVACAPARPDAPAAPFA